jgi:hypothetical protein
MAHNAVGARRSTWRTFARVEHESPPLHRAGTESANPVRCGVMDSRDVRVSMVFGVLASAALGACAAISGLDALQVCHGAACAAIATDGATVDESPVVADGGNGGGDGGTESGPPPPIEFVQAGATDAIAAPTANVSFPAAVSAHSAIVVGINYDLTSAAVTLISDTLGSTYDVVMGPIDGTTGRYYIAVALDVVGGPGTVTIARDGGATSYFQVYVHEYSGLARSAAFDVSAWRSGTSSATDGVRSGRATTTFPRELIFGFATFSSGGRAGTGYRQRSSFNANVTEDKIAANEGGYETTATMTSGSQWTMLMATFRGQ